MTRALGQIDDATARALVLHFGLKGAIDYATKIFQMGGPLAKEYGWLADEEGWTSDTVKRLLATIDAQATEIAALKEALEELRQVYHHVVHRGELDECELLLCQRARRVLAGKEAQGATEPVPHTVSKRKEN